MAGETAEVPDLKQEPQSDSQKDQPNLNGGQGNNNQNRGQNSRPRGGWKGKNFVNVSINYAVTFPSFFFI